MAERPDTRPGRHAHAGREHDMRLNDDIRCDDGVMREEDSFGRNEGDTAFHKRYAPPCLKNAFCFG